MTTGFTLPTGPTPQLAAPPRPYRLHLAQGPEDLRAAQALRFEVFNLELDEGLVQSYDSGLDADDFDPVCDHLLVRHGDDGPVVGTYRLQTGLSAQRHLGYYSAQEFDLAPFDHARGEIVELGRACIHHNHRHLAVLNLLWRGIAHYAQQQGARYLIGCSSLTSQHAPTGASAYQALQARLAPPEWRVQPQPGWACELADESPQPAAIPRLLRTYLALGAAVCGPPAIDRAFRTIDFLTWADLASPALLAWQRRSTV